MRRCGVKIALLGNFNWDRRTFWCEGPIIMTGGAFGSLFAQLFELSANERKTLLVAGAAAGFDKCLRIMLDVAPMGDDQFIEIPRKQRSQDLSPKSLRIMQSKPRMANRQPQPLLPRRSNPP